MPWSVPSHRCCITGPRHGSEAGHVTPPLLHHEATPSNKKHGFQEASVHARTHTRTHTHAHARTHTHTRGFQEASSLISLSAASNLARNRCCIMRPCHVCETTMPWLVRRPCHGSEAGHAMVRKLAMPWSVKRVRRSPFLIFCRRPFVRRRPSFARVCVCVCARARMRACVCVRVRAPSSAAVYMLVAVRGGSRRLSFAPVPPLHRHTPSPPG
jgi:hypothetical protein